MLMKRFPSELRHLMDKYGEHHLASQYAADVRKCANNERSVQCKQIKMTWLSKTNCDFQLAENLLEQELDADNNSHARLHKNIKADFKDVENLREAIRSGQMYTFPRLFDLFCSGVEAGNFRNAVSRKPQSIARYMTTAHEAHFRLELWFALGKKSFRHQTYPSWLKVRAKNFVEFLHLVADDRKKNLVEAVRVRMEARRFTTVDDGEEDSDDGSADGVEIDPALLA
jgi:hypothetical protein